MATTKTTYYATWNGETEKRTSARTYTHAAVYRRNDGEEVIGSFHSSEALAAKGTNGWKPIAVVPVTTEEPAPVVAEEPEPEATEESAPEIAGKIATGKRGIYVLISTDGRAFDLDTFGPSPWYFRPAGETTADAAGEITSEEFYDLGTVRCSYSTTHTAMRIGASQVIDGVPACDKCAEFYAAQQAR